MNKILFKKKKIVQNFIFIILFISIINCVEKITFTKKTKKKIEVLRESTTNIIYKKNFTKINLIKDGVNSNYYSSGIYNFIEFDIPKDTEVNFHFIGDCIIPIVLSTDPTEFSNSYNFINDKVNIFFNDIGVPEFKDLEVNGFKEFENIIENSNSIKDMFKNQETVSFTTNHRGVIYCFEFENQDFKSLSFEVTWTVKTAVSEEETPTPNPIEDESKVDDENVETNTPKDKPKETIFDNNITLDFDTGSTEVYYENVFEIESTGLTFDLQNLNKFTIIDIQDLKNNQMNMELVYDISNKSITQTETKNRLEASFEDAENMVITIKLDNPSITSFLSFKVTSDEESSSDFWTTTNIIIFAVVFSLLIIIIIIIIIFCVLKKKNKKESGKENDKNLNKSENVKIIKKTDDDDLIPVYQVDFKQKKFHKPDEEKNQEYPRMEESVNSIDKNNNVNYPDQIHESEIKKEPAKK